MVPPNEVILEFHYSFGAIRVVLFQKKEQFGLNCRLIVVLLLILDHLDCNIFAFLVVSALDDLAEGAFADHLTHFKSVANLVSIDDPVVALSIVKAVVDQSLLLGGLVLLIWLCDIPDFFIFLNLTLLVTVQEVFSRALLKQGLARHWEFERRLGRLLLDCY